MPVKTTLLPVELLRHVVSMSHLDIKHGKIEVKLKKMKLLFKQALEVCC